MTIMVALVILFCIIFLVLVDFFSNNRKENSRGKVTYEPSTTAKEWWQKHRLKYNWGLIIAGFVAFLIYYIIGVTLIAPNDEKFEITLFTVAFQAAGYFVMVLIANLLYYLGHYVDKKFNKQNSTAFRRKLFNLGFWFSIALPFLIPTILLIQYFIEFRKNRVPKDFSKSHSLQHNPSISSYCSIHSLIRSMLANQKHFCFLCQVV